MDFPPDLEILEGAELFRGVPATALHEVQAASFRKRIAAGDVVFRQGDAAGTLYIVATGRLRATQTTADGQQANGRYTDCWAKQNGKWLAVSAHVSR